MKNIGLKVLLLGCLLAQPLLTSCTSDSGETIDRDNIPLLDADDFSQVSTQEPEKTKTELIGLEEARTIEKITQDKYNQYLETDGAVTYGVLKDGPLGANYDAMFIPSTKVIAFKVTQDYDDSIVIGSYYQYQNAPKYSIVGSLTSYPDTNNNRLFLSRKNNIYIGHLSHNGFHVSETNITTKDNEKLVYIDNADDGYRLIFLDSSSNFRQFNLYYDGELQAVKELGNHWIEGHTFHSYSRIGANQIKLTFIENSTKSYSSLYLDVES